MHSAQYLKAIGARITDLRKKRGLSLSEFGAECGIDKPNLVPIEKGRINVSIRTLLKIAAAFDLPLKDLLPEGKVDLTKSITPGRRSKKS